MGELTLKLGPTGAGVHAFWGTDLGCQCTRSGPTAKSYPSGLFFFGPSGARVAAEGHREPSLGNRNPFLSYLNPTENHWQKKSKGPRNPKSPKMCHTNANQTCAGY